jgi:hypothetical protein
MARNRIIGLFIAVVVLLGLAYVGTALVLASKRMAHQERWRAQLLQVRELGAAAAPTLLAAAKLRPLGEACRGVLPPKGFKALVGYLVPPELPPGSDRFGGEVTAFSPIAHGIATDYMHHAEHPPDFGFIFRDALDPFTWDNEPAGVDLAGASYLAVTVALGLRFPKLSSDDKSFSSGEGELRTRVVSLPEGRTLCQGRSSPVTPEKLEAKGFGRTKEAASASAALSIMRSLEWRFKTSVVHVPLAEICGAADERYCTWVRGQLDLR